MKRHYSTIDSRTVLTLVLSDASYNMAMERLQSECSKYGREIFRCEAIDDTRTVIYTGEPRNGYDFNGNPDVWYSDLVRFYYDEERGLLMQE